MPTTSFAHSIAGRRGNNEDSFFVAPELGLYLLADGMGGYHGGEVASRLAVSTIGEFFRLNAEDRNITWPESGDRKRTPTENMVLVAVRMANRAVMEARTGEHHNMGTTLALLVLGMHQAVLAHVGDSRIYCLNRGGLTQLTRDHSLYEHLLASGAADLPSREEFGYSNVIMRAIGLKDGNEPDIMTVSVKPGDTFLLCSDGLSGVLGNEILEDRLRAETPELACRGLIQEAYDQGSRDNITAIVVRADPPRLVERVWNWL
jgi:PPM family protein phosphatase